MGFSIPMYINVCTYLLYMYTCMYVHIIATSAVNMQELAYLFQPNFRKF